MRCSKRNERINVANALFAVLDVLLFPTDESPTLIELQPFALQVAHQCVHKSRAALADANAWPHNRIAVNAGHSFNAAVADAFGQCAHCRDLLFRWQVALVYGMTLLVALAGENGNEPGLAAIFPTGDAVAVFT